MEQQQQINGLEGMMDSCFTYGGLDAIKIGSQDFTRYIEPYKAKLGDEDLFNDVYNKRVEYLKTCKVVVGSYTDSEGCSYNSLVHPKN